MLILDIYSINQPINQRLFSIQTNSNTPYRLMPVKINFPHSMNIWHLLPCTSVSHVTPSVCNFDNFAMPAIRAVQPLYSAALISISYECLFNFYLL